jgi:DNA-binding response OmpR family regulator
MRILVIEDEHRIGTSIKKGLEMEKYAVDLAFDGRDGYDLALTEDYDCIILDLMLPGMDGISVCRKLREENIHTPVLILTAIVYKDGKENEYWLEGKKVTKEDVETYQQNNRESR